MLGDLFRYLVHRLRIGKYLCRKIVHVVVIQVYIMGKLEIVFLLIPERLKEIFLQQRNDLIVKSIGLFRKKDSLVTAFIAHPVYR